MTNRVVRAPLHDAVRVHTDSETRQRRGALTLEFAKRRYTMTAVLYAILLVSVAKHDSGAGSGSAVIGWPVPDTGNDYSYNTRECPCSHGAAQPEAIQTVSCPWSLIRSRRRHVGPGSTSRREGDSDCVGRYFRPTRAPSSLALPCLAVSRPSHSSATARPPAASPQPSPTRPSLLACFPQASASHCCSPRPSMRHVSPPPIVCRRCLSPSRVHCAPPSRALLS